MIPGKATRAVVAFLLVVSIFIGGLLSVDHQLHEWAHAEAHTSGHQCLATMLSSGQAVVETGLAAVVLLMLGRALGVLPALPLIDFSSMHYRLPPGRAPPVHQA